MDSGNVIIHPPMLGNDTNAPNPVVNRQLDDLAFVSFDGSNEQLASIQRAIYSYLRHPDIKIAIKDSIERGQTYVRIDLSALCNSPDESYRFLYSTLLETPDVFHIFDMLLHQAALAVVASLRDGHLKKLWDESPNISRDAFLSSSAYNNAIAYYTKVAGNLHLRCFPVNFPAEDSQSLRTLGPDNADRLISVSGMVSNVSSRVPEMVEACFQCVVCKDVKRVPVKRGKIAAPIRCTNCDSLQSIEIMHNLCSFIDKRVVKIQESPDQLPSGLPPISCSFVAYDLDLNNIRPGDRVVVVGIYRLKQTRPNQTQAVCNAALKPMVELLSISLVDVAATDDFWAKDKAASPDLEKLRTLDPNTSYPEYYSCMQRLFPDLIPETDSASDERLLKLVNSIAPSIFGPTYLDVKMGLLLQCFGGVQKDAYRGQIHILLVGDPGLAKSKLLQYVSKISPRSVYASGKGSSQAGLTATVTRHPETHEFYLDPGALLLSDGGVCCLDEFDKSTEDVRSSLHEVMEHGQLSIAKAGILATLSARTSILAAANPIDSCYNPKRTVVQNLNIPPSLLSRFDLIYLLLDNRSDVEADRALASWLVDMYINGDSVEDAGNQDPSGDWPHPMGLDTWSPQTLRQYIYFAQKLTPVLSKPAQEALLLSYNQLRSGSYSGSGRITATPRQLLSLVRLAEARARMRFSSFVTANDVYVVSQLMVKAMRLTITDQSGFINMDILSEGAADVEDEARLNMLCRTITRYKNQRMAEMRGDTGSEPVTVTMTGLLGVVNRTAPQSGFQSIGGTSLEMLSAAVDMLASQGIVIRSDEDIIFI